MPDGVSNGSMIQGGKRSRIVELIAQGHSLTGIAQRLKVTRPTLRAVRDAEFATISRRKSIIAAQHERVATLALNLINDELEQSNRGDVPLPVLNVLAGTSSDKMLSLRGDAVATIQHLHTHRMSQDDVYAFALERSKHSVIEAQVVEAPPLLANGDVSQIEATNASYSGQIDSKRGQHGIKMRPTDTETHSNPDARARKKRRRRGESDGPTQRKKSQ